MHGNTNATDESNDPTRRSVLGRGLASVGLALGLPTRVGALDQEETTQRDGEYRARIYETDFRSGARFWVVSKPLDYKPHVPVQEGEAFLEDLYWNGYDTRIIHYEGTNRRVLFFPALDVPIERDAPYRMGRVRSADQLADGIVSVGFGPVENGGGTER